MVVKNKFSRQNNSIPAIGFDNIDSEISISNLFETKRSIKEYLGLVFLRLGFKASDNILLYNYNKDNNSFDCMINGNDYYNVFLNQGNNLELILRKFNIENGYIFEPLEVSEIGVKITLSRYSVRYIDGRKVTCYLSDNAIKFTLELDNYILDLELDKPDELELPMFVNGRYSKYRLDNEKEIFEYLSSVSILSSCVDIYKEMSEKLLGDINGYPRFCLRLSMLDGVEKVNVLDLIELRCGNFEKMIITDKKENVTVSVDKDDNWSYRILGNEKMPVDFQMSCQGGKMSCMFSMSEEMDMEEYTEDSVRSDMRVAVDEVILVRRKVRTLFNKKC